MPDQAKLRLVGMTKLYRNGEGVRGISLEVDEAEWEQTRAYIKATSDSHFFVGEDKALSLARTVKEPLRAIDIAIGFEKDTLLFFYELLNVTPAASRAAAEAIVEEEKRHVLMLAERRKRLAGG